MPAAYDLATILVAHRGPLPAPARQFVADTAIALARRLTVAASVFCAAALGRADLTEAEALRVFNQQAGANCHVQAAWLARPEHDLTTLPRLVLAAATDSNDVDYLDTLVWELLNQPLCRPQVRDVLAAASERLAAAVRTADRSGPKTRPTEGTLDLDLVCANSVDALSRAPLPVRAVAADYLVTALRDDVDAWRVLCASVAHLPGWAPLAGLVTVATAVSLPAAGQAA